MNPRHFDILRHSLGADQYGRIPRNGRNFFCAGVKDEPDCRELVAQGLMVEHHRTDVYPYYNCSVTDAGRRAMKDAAPIAPKLTASQKRYRRFLDADLGISFREFMDLERQET